MLTPVLHIAFCNLPVASDAIMHSFHNANTMVNSFLQNDKEALQIPLPLTSHENVRDPISQAQRAVLTVHVAYFRLWLVLVTSRELRVASNDKLGVEIFLWQTLPGCNPCHIATSKGYPKGCIWRGFTVQYNFLEVWIHVYTPCPKTSHIMFTKHFRYWRVAFSLGSLISE